MSREFFSVKTMAEARDGFQPSRRTLLEEISLEQSLGRVTARDILNPTALPGFARAAVDGFAVRAANTFGASTTLPALLRISGEVSMGEMSERAIADGEAVAIPTGGALPGGADAVVMVENTSASAGNILEVHQAAAPGEAVVRPDEDVAAGQKLIAAHCRLRPEHLGLLAAAGIISLAVYARPRVAIVSTGDEIVPQDTSTLAPGQIRDATAIALGGLVQAAGGTPDPRGIIPDDPEQLHAVLENALAGSDMVIVSAGSSVGTRDVTAEVVAALGEPGIWCHGIAIKPGKPTLLAECQGVPIVGLPGNPASALVVFRMLGTPLVRLIGGQDMPPAIPTTTATLTRDLPSVPGRLDVVQVRLSGGQAEPIFAKSSALSALAQADGQIVVPESTSGLYADTSVTVELHDWALGHG